MSIKKTLILLCILLVKSMVAQKTTTFCKNNEELKSILGASYSYKLDSVSNLQQIHADNYSQETTRSGTVYYIPVVYHILHQGGEENISDEQILDDLEQINILFRKQNPSALLVDTAFDQLTADIEIEFRLAQRKNDGTCFSGITRTISSATNTGGNAAVNAVINAHGVFPGDKYMNIFVCKDIGGAAGYTYNPFDPSMGNGIFIVHNYVGRIGTSTQTIENSTMAHEAGHWLNLDHLWGNSNNPGIATNCNDDDGVADTPNTIGWTSCSIGGVTCGSRDNVENIMEYSYCPNNMFTLGQKNRMRAAITSNVANRDNVISGTNHVATGIFENVLCVADFSVNNQTTCAGTSIQFKDLSYHNATSWSWSFPGGTPSSSNIKNPTVVYNTPGNYNVSLTATNSSGSLSVSKSNFMKVLSSTGKPTPYYEGFEGLTNLNNEFTSISNATNSWNITSNTGFSGNKSIILENLYNDYGTITSLISNNIDLQGMNSVTISFKYAYAKTTNSTGEQAQLFYSNDCGETWFLVRGLLTSVPNTNSYFTPTNSSEWRTLTSNIGNSFLNSSFRFMVRVKNGDGNNIYIDDINISGVVSIDELMELSSFEVFPNPMNNNATILFSLKEVSEVGIEVLDLTGKVVDVVLPLQTLNTSEHRYPVTKANISKGIYFIKITVNNKQKLHKIVVQ